MNNPLKMILFDTLVLKKIYGVFTMKYFILFYLLTPSFAFSAQEYYLYDSSANSIFVYDLKGEQIAKKVFKRAIFDSLNNNKTYFYQGEIYAFTKKYLLIINIANLTKKTISLGELLNNQNLEIHNIISVDSNHIYFNLASIDWQSISERTFLGYSYNKTLKSFKLIDISNNLYQISSAVNGKYYFNDSNDNIFEKSAEKIFQFEFKGKYPTVSPDGKYLALYKNRFFWGTLYIYDLIKKKNILEIRTIAGLESRIRWSPNSQYVALKQISGDIRKGSTHVFDIDAKRIILKFKEPNREWFLAPFISFK